MLLVHSDFMLDVEINSPVSTEIVKKHRSKPEVKQNALIVLWGEKNRPTMNK